ncbi:hypothetical protein PoB_006681500 [Plakobranchus ocellatus]|uniref:WH2 domain-containing protein n=1 Tax=Plakobranchus ocellatus TaxID=259542 RepID=A0AAV4D8C6_9GAST|nr:hypothetical protein PoB_006681500 [Plakobranchus ocellatus]
MRNRIKVSGGEGQGEGEGGGGKERGEGGRGGGDKERLEEREKESKARAPMAGLEPPRAESITPMEVKEECKSSISMNNDPKKVIVPRPVHNKVISGFQVLRQARAPVARLEPATERSVLADLRAGSLATVPPTPPSPNPPPPPPLSFDNIKGKKMLKFYSKRIVCVLQPVLYKFTAGFLILPSDSNRPQICRSQGVFPSHSPTL